MIARQQERTFQMMKNFIPLHNEGYSIEAIAKRYNLTTSTVYNRLGEIAEKAGVSRDSLLERPFIADHAGRNFTPVKPVERAKFDETFSALVDMIDSVQDQIAKTIDDLNTTIEEEEKA